jgi:hypothetical protein
MMREPLLYLMVAVLLALGAVAVLVVAFQLIGD